MSLKNNINRLVEIEPEREALGAAPAGTPIASATGVALILAGTEAGSDHVLTPPLRIVMTEYEESQFPIEDGSGAVIGYGIVAHDKSGTLIDGAGVEYPLTIERTE